MTFRKQRWFLAAAAFAVLGLCIGVGLGSASRADDAKPGGGKGKGGDGKGGKAGDGKSGGKADTKEPAATGPFKVGDEVKDVTIELAAGGSWTASGARGKFAVLVFAASFSTESIDALKRLGDPKGSVAGTGAGVLGVLRDADATAAKKVATDQKLTVALGIDPKRRHYDRFARKGLPYTVVLDTVGKVVWSESGFDDAAVARKIEELKVKR